MPVDFSPASLQTDRLFLRRWRESDREPFRAINADPRVTEFYPVACTADESDRIIERAETHFDKHGFGLFAVARKADDVLLGFVGLQNVPFEAHFTPAVEIGWRIGHAYWNEGYATEAARRVLEHGFTDLRLNEIVALTAVINVRSRRVMEKLGLTYDPKDDFENPKIEAGHRLRSHVVYRARRP